ncbi:putative inorganic phosphate cotransporter isoform X1 [Trichogramma pretiosum]|uniref:putative inorganic phosphate cotransporter isoform X1 n=1 Tax=Trichogramma pretiosum TaxID=7493 RepID=UPI0006C96FAC|nr:putative inorganic phosphate cotransporter isoform X1 [Trichogramma pretiosum]
MTKGKEWISCRDVLWLMVFWGFGINYMLRNNLNLAIVTMVVPREKSVAATECGSGNSTSTLQAAATEQQQPGQYPWNEYQQSMALGAYYWLHWLLQLPGGLLARRYGTKMIFGLGNVLVAVLGFALPYATHYSLGALVAVRALQGLISGVVWPSMHDMTAKWIPPNERSRFVSSYLGSSVGAAVTYPLCATIISNYNWEAVFHITSLIGIVWYVFWLFLVYDSPQQHPRILESEKNYICKSLAANDPEMDEDDYKAETEEPKGANKRVPWRAIMTSGPFWVTIVAHWGGVWGFITFMTQAPSYFKYVHGWNIRDTGLLSGSPHVARMIFSYLFSMLADWLLRTKRMTLTGVRKLANLVCAGGQALLTLGLSFSGCEPVYAAVLMIAGTAINGAVSSGTIPAFVDLSPNYASVLFGINNLITSPSGFLSPLVVGILTNDNQTIGQWRLVFLVSAANLAVSCVVHLIWGTSEEQPWNNYAREKRRIKDAESASPAETKEFIEAKSDEEDDKAKGEVKAEQ